MSRELTSAVVEARALRDRGEHEPALTVIRDALAASPDDDPARSEALLLCGVLQHDTGDPNGARQALYDAARAAALGQRDDVSARAWIRLLEIVGYTLGHPEEAAALEHAADCAVLRAGDPDELRGEFLNAAANARNARADHDAALDMHERAYHRIVAALGDAHPRVGTFAQNLASGYAYVNRFDDALAWDERALAIRRRSLPDGHPEVLKSFGNVAGSLMALERFDDARAMLEHTIDTGSRALGPDHLIVANARHNLGSMLLACGDPAAAAAPLERALATYERVHGADHSHTRTCLSALERCREATAGDAASQPVTFDRYELLERIGSGGVGDVYRARVSGADGFRKDVAVKRLRLSTKLDPYMHARLVREAKLLVTLSHANLVSVLDLCRERGDVYVVLELVDGRDLRELLAAGARALPLGLAAHIVRCACAGLGYAHSRPQGAVIHADVSPANILLSRTGEVKVTDFGIARVDDTPRTGTVEGKYPYMAPEQLRGDVLTPRTDVFAVGVVLYELIAGSRPFLGDTPEQVAAAIIAGDCPPLSEVRPDAPATLAAVCDRALAGDPAQRYRTAGELGDAIADVAFSCGWRDDRRAVARFVGERLAARDGGAARRAALAALGISTSEHTTERVAVTQLTGTVLDRDRAAGA